jgi:hypothetical protein
MLHFRPSCFSYTEARNKVERASYLKNPRSFIRFNGGTTYCVKQKNYLKKAFGRIWKFDLHALVS